MLDQYPDHEIAVEGHTDATGPDEYNQRLSEQRAASVRVQLIDGGIDANRITSRGLGESTPVASNDNAAGRQQNRRVEIVVLGAGTVAEASQGQVVSPVDSILRDTTLIRRDTLVRPDTTVRPPR